MVAALQSSSGASRALLLAALTRTIVPVVSTPLMLEYEAVLTRPEILARADVDATDVAAILDEFASVCLPVTLDFRWRPVAADPDDDLVIETAVNGMAACIATFNIRDMIVGAARFGIAVERPGRTLRRIRS